MSSVFWLTNRFKWLFLLVALFLLLFLFGCSVSPQLISRSNSNSTPVEATASLDFSTELIAPSSAQEDLATTKSTDSNNSQSGQAASSIEEPLQSPDPSLIDQLLEP
jgi:hypothetical protein